MSYICKHYTIKLVLRRCSRCDEAFEICPLCARRLEYSWLCEDCEKAVRRAAIRRMKQNQADLIMKHNAD